MYKLDLSQIIIMVATEEGEKEFPYQLADSIVNILCASGPGTQQRLSNTGLLRNWEIGKKIIAADGDHVLLEDEEYTQLKLSFEQFRQFGRYDVKMCERVRDAEKVEVEEKAPENT